MISEKQLTEQEWIEQHAKEVNPTFPGSPRDGRRSDRSLISPWIFERGQRLTVVDAEPTDRDNLRYRLGYQQTLL